MQVSIEFVQKLFVFWPVVRRCWLHDAVDKICKCVICERGFVLDVMS